MMKTRSLKNAWMHCWKPLKVCDLTGDDNTMCITLRWSDDCSYSCRFSLLTQACMMFCLISTPYGVFPYCTHISAPHPILADYFILFCLCCLLIFLYTHFFLSFPYQKRILAFFNNCWWSLRKFLVVLLAGWLYLHHQSYTNQHSRLLCMALKWNCLSFFF